jgi:hypothetical protein
MIRIVFDQAKRDATLIARDLAFEDAALVFVGATVDAEEVRHAYPETRFITVGHLSGRIVVVVWTPVDDETRRVISMRRCNARGQKIYAPYFE